jgi:hypothetical protein
MLLATWVLHLEIVRSTLAWLRPGAHIRRARSVPRAVRPSAVAARKPGVEVLGDRDMPGDTAGGFALAALGWPVPAPAACVGEPCTVASWTRRVKTDPRTQVAKRPCRSFKTIVKPMRGAPPGSA